MDVIIKLKIKQRRIQSKLTVEELSKLSGVSKAHISYCERGEKEPTLKVLCKLAIALNTLPEDLYTYDVI
jgi:transcriptional regulator with XRE-family HTH domain